MVSAFTFTPLFRARLASLQPDFYTHGSAILNTIQQVMVLSAPHCSPPSWPRQKLPGQHKEQLRWNQQQPESTKRR
jgi:hypothetical protein